MATRKTEDAIFPLFRPDQVCRQLPRVRRKGRRAVEGSLRQDEDRAPKKQRRLSKRRSRALNRAPSNSASRPSNALRNQCRKLALAHGSSARREVALRTRRTADRLHPQAGRACRRAGRRRCRKQRARSPRTLPSPARMRGKGDVQLKKADRPRRINRIRSKDRVACHPVFCWII